jgi:ribosomal-protein-alanine N-acetyltransferase
MDDFENFHCLNGDEEIMHYIRPAQAREQSKIFFDKIMAKYIEQPALGRWGMFAKEDHRFVGSFAIIPVEDSNQLQVGYALIKEEWGKGYASESVKGGLKYAFQQLDLSEIVAITYPGNIASQKVLLRNGFVFDKTFIEDDKELNIYLCKR